MVFHGGSDFVIDENCGAVIVMMRGAAASTHSLIHSHTCTLPNYYFLRWSLLLLLPPLLLLMLAAAQQKSVAQVKSTTGDHACLYIIHLIRFIFSSPSSALQ